MNIKAQTVPRLAVFLLLMLQQCLNGAGSWPPQPANQPASICIMSSQVCQNYKALSEAGVNSMVNQFLCTSYTYLSLGFSFTWDNVALSKFESFFQHLSEEKHEQAEKLMTFHGGSAVLQDVKKMEQDEWGNRASPTTFTLQLEKRVNQALLYRHQVTSCHVDPHMCDFLETHYLDEELKLIKKLGNHVTNLKRVHASKDSPSEYLFNCLTLGESSD